MWPPPLLRTAVRMFSGTLLIPASKLLNRKLLKIRLIFERFVEVGDVSAVVLVVVDLHRLCVNVRLECIEGVRERRQCVSHLGSGSLSRSLSHSIYLLDSLLLLHNYTRLA